MIKTYHFIVSGRVQGVGYRFTAYLNAKKLGLVGYVKNLDNGNVEVFAQGNENLIEDFRKYLKLGSFMSKVDLIKEDIIERESFEEFQIKY